MCPFAGGTEHGFTIAEGIAVKQPGTLTAEILRDRLDEVVTVTDEQISHAIVLLLERTKLLVEGAGAASVAALLEGKVAGDDEACAIVSGGNIDPTLLIQVMRHGLTTAGRYLVLRTRLSDRPGELIKLLELVADERGNVVSVEHHREGMALPIAQTEVELTLSTRDAAHCDELLDVLRERATWSSASRSRHSSLVSATAELDGVAAAGGPGGDAAVEYGPRVDSLRGQDRRGDARSGPRLADRHDRAIGGYVGAADPEQAIGDVAAARDVAVVALVALPHVDQLRATRQQLLELVEVDRLHPLCAAAENVALELEEPDRLEAANRTPGLAGARGLDGDRLRCIEDERGPGRE